MFDIGRYLPYNTLATVMRCDMRLNLHEIINIPGGTKPFGYDPDVSDINFESVKAVVTAPHAAGQIRNSAGVLVMNYEITADFVCQCARCLTEFEKHISITGEAVISDERQDEDNPDIYLLDGEVIDVDEIIITAFVLNMEQRFLCSEDCKGLCSTCGKDLNVAPCDCKAPLDPRLAVLGQLLENE